MSNNPTLPKTLREPLVIPLHQPSQPGSAVERSLWDLYSRGLVPDVSPSYTTRPAKDTTSADSRSTLTGIDVTSSDSGETTAYSTDTTFSEDTTYSDDFPYEIAGKGTSIAAGVNEGGSESYTLGTRINLDPPRTMILVSSQLFSVLIKIIKQPVADLPELAQHSKSLKEVTYMLNPDNGSNTTWIMGHNCQRAVVSSDSTGTGTAYSLYPWGVILPGDKGPPKTLGKRALIYDHAYVNGTDLPDSVPRPTTDIINYADKSAVAILLHDKEMKMQMECYNWTEESWKGLISLRYKPAVAYAVSGHFSERWSSGILALGPMRRQASFGSAVNVNDGPSFIEALSKEIPPIFGGNTILYFAIRPPGFYGETETGYQLIESQAAEHWISVNGWPCELQPAWSKPIHLAPAGNLKSWKVRLLSMTFQRYNKDKGCYEPLHDPDSGTIKFGDDGLIVLLDCGKSVSLMYRTYFLIEPGFQCLAGTSVTWVPPVIVRYIRTKVWPTDKNKEIDARDQDTPCSIDNLTVPFYVPEGELSVLTVTYKFAGRRGKVVEVVGPGNHFLGQPNPKDHRHSKEQEGLLFIGPPDVVRGEAIFGLNFFQSMFIALYTPSSSYGDGPYVTLAPQWGTQVLQFSPRREAESRV